ncbi:MAG: GWxTD domain-containing protein [bacterium]
MFAQFFTVDHYRFQDGYTELWYQLSISDILTYNEQVLVQKSTILKEFSYRLGIYDDVKKDSAFIEGTKGAYITRGQQTGYFIDHIPVYLYPGNFSYCFTVESSGYEQTKTGRIEILSDTIIFQCSDVILGLKNEKDKFECHRYIFTPNLALEFTNQDTLFSYLEIYGLIPDSLYCSIKYQIIDVSDSIVFERDNRRLKYEYIDADTLTVVLHDFIDGEYTFLVESFDSAWSTTISSRKTFRITSIFDETAAMEFYYEIQYLVSVDEYKKFCNLDEHKKQVYLKQFWSEVDYWQFEERLLEADGKFSISTLKGRDSERGKFCIVNGLPDLIEEIAPTNWGLQFEVWHYYSAGFDAVFCDTKLSGNPILIKILRIGELTSILEQGYRRGDEDDWLFEIAPGSKHILNKPED